MADLFPSLHTHSGLLPLLFRKNSHSIGNLQHVQRRMYTMKKAFTMITALVLLAGCAESTAAVSAEAEETTVYTTSSKEENTEKEEDTEEDDSLYSDRDMEQEADLSEAKTIKVSDNQDVSITEEGVYVITGTAENVTITVNAAEDAKVQLVLDNVSITNESRPVIEALEADKLFITTAEGSENTFTVNRAFETGNGSDAVIDAGMDLTMNGPGTLTINSAGDAVSAADDLTITGGTYVINSGEDGFEVNDVLAVADGTFTIDAGKDGFHAENSDDDTLGIIVMDDGSYTINADDDGIQGNGTVTINDGTYDIDAVEGIEGTTITINGGTIAIDASDDGINAARKSAAYDVAIIVNDGDITINMGAGDTDAMDANGSITINGGNINITGSSAFDYDTTGTLNGGTVTVNGQQVTQLTSSMPGGGGMRGGMQNGMGRGMKPSSDTTTGATPSQQGNGV